MPLNPLDVDLDLSRVEARGEAAGALICELGLVRRGRRGIARGETTSVVAASGDNVGIV
jgi:hypothetical protein